MCEGSPGGAPRTGPVRGTDVAVIECGRVASRVLAEETEGVVSAVFRRSCYLDFAGGRMICMGDRSLGRGPLNARVDRFQPPCPGDVLGLRADRAIVWRPSISHLGEKV